MDVRDERPIDRVELLEGAPPGDPGPADDVVEFRSHETDRRDARNAWPMLFAAAAIAVRTCLGHACRGIAFAGMGIGQA
ncbi:hypothetical protein GCM10009565_34930 [Amycolatopsis albidoflavus]